MLKEQVAEIIIDKVMAEIEKDHFDLYEKALAVMDVCKKEVIRQLDKLTVIDDMSLAIAKSEDECVVVVKEWGECGECSGNCRNIAEAQLQADKKQLYDLIGG